MLEAVLHLWAILQEDALRWHQQEEEAFTVQSQLEYTPIALMAS